MKDIVLTDIGAYKLRLPAPFAKLLWLLPPYGDVGNFLSMALDTRYKDVFILSCIVDIFSHLKPYCV